jgi:hypothetical protein
VSFVLLLVFLLLKMASTATAAEPTSQWDNLEPHCQENAIYSKILKADLLPGTFIVLAKQGVNQPSNSGISSSFAMARILSVQSPSEVTVNIFKRLSDVLSDLALHPPVLPQENHLQHMQEVVQTVEVCGINERDIKNLCFVFSLSTIKDTFQDMHFFLMVWLYHLF